MMRKVLVLAVLAGCGGGGFCKRQAKAAEDCGDTVDDAAIDACEESLSGCSAADERKLVAFFDCWNELAPCGEDATDTEDAFSMLGCALELQGISPDCYQIDFDVDTTTPTG